MKKVKKLLYAIILPTFILSNSLNVFAVDKNGKEEVIYIMTNLGGDVNYVYAVNIFNGGNIVDYGNYSKVKMLTTNDKINVNGDQIEINSNADKVYYEGTMENKEIPWDISIKYFLDDKEVFGNELGGKSGKLKIKLNINKNENFNNSSFYDDFALQVILKFDTEITKNIVSNGATVANVGKKKQLMYTILPGKDLDTEITCDINNFEMDAIDINGVKMSFDIDIDSSSVEGELGDFQSGIAELNNGAHRLKNGIGEARTGGNKLQDGINKLKNGAGALEEGVGKLKAGLETAGEGIKMLNDKADVLTSSSNKFKEALIQMQNSVIKINKTTNNLGSLSAASSKISTGLDTLYTGVESLYNKTGYNSFKAILGEKGLDVDSVRSKNEQLINSLKSQIGQLSGRIQMLQEAGEQEEISIVSSQIQALEETIKVLTVNNLVYGGIESYLNGLKDGQKQILDGSLELRDKYKEFDFIIQNISTGFTEIVATVSKFADAINLLVDNYSKLNDGIVEYTDGVKKLYAGYSEILKGIQALTDGSKSLKNGANELGSGSSKLTNGLNELYNGAIKLSDGTTTLRNRTSDLDTKIEDKVNEMIEKIKGTGKETVSFVSSKNTNVKSVQFVIKTDSIIRPKVENALNEEQKPMGFWEKFTNLFKKKK